MSAYDRIKNEFHKTRLTKNVHVDADDLHELLEEYFYLKIRNIALEGYVKEKLAEDDSTAKVAP